MSHVTCRQCIVFCCERHWDSRQTIVFCHKRHLYSNQVDSTKETKKTKNYFTQTVVKTSNTIVLFCFATLAVHLVTSIHQSTLFRVQWDGTTYIHTSQHFKHRNLKKLRELPSHFLCGIPLPWMDSVLYLGITVTNQVGVRRTIL